MKKFLIASAMICLAFVCTGCHRSTESLVKANMSEITENYYFVENSQFSLSISVGKRENPYLIDGNHRGIVDFSLVIFKDKTFELKDKTLPIKIEIAGQICEVMLEYNPISCAYMADLGFAIGKKEEVVFVWQDEKILCPLISENFEISCPEALKLSSNKFDELIQKYATGSSLKGECYLKILGLKGDDNNLFWCFTFVGEDNRSYNLIISITDGSILASDF